MIPESHTGLLLVTAYEPSTKPGNTRVSLTMGTLGKSCLSSRAFTIKSSVVAANTSRHSYDESKNYTSWSFEPSFWKQQS